MSTTAMAALHDHPTSPPPTPGGVVMHAIHATSSMAATICPPPRRSSSPRTAAASPSCASGAAAAANAGPSQTPTPSSLQVASHLSPHSSPLATAGPSSTPHLSSSPSGHTHHTSLDRRPESVFANASLRVHPFINMGHNATKLAPVDEPQGGQAKESRRDRERPVVAPSRPAPPPPVAVAAAAAAASTAVAGASLHANASAKPLPLTTTTTTTATTTTTPTPPSRPGPAKLQKSAPAPPTTDEVSTSGSSSSPAPPPPQPIRVPVPLQPLQSLPPAQPHRRGLGIVRKMSFRTRDRERGGAGAVQSAAVSAQSPSRASAIDAAALASAPSAVASTASHSSSNDHSTSRKLRAASDDTGSSKPRVLMRNASTGHVGAARPRRSPARATRRSADASFKPANEILGSSPPASGSSEMTHARGTVYGSSPPSVGQVVDDGVVLSSSPPSSIGPERRQRLVPRSEAARGPAHSAPTLEARTRVSATAKREREWREKLATLSIVSPPRSPGPALPLSSGPRPPPRRKHTPPEVADGGSSAEVSPTRGHKQQVETLANSFGGLGLGLGVDPSTVGAPRRSTASVVSSVASSHVHISPAVSAVGRNNNNAPSASRSVSASSYLDSANYFDSRSVTPRGSTVIVSVHGGDMERRPLSTIIQEPGSPASDIPPPSPAFTLALGLQSPPTEYKRSEAGTPSASALSLALPPPVASPAMSTRALEWTPDERVVVSRASVPDFPRTPNSSDMDRGDRTPVARSPSQCASSERGLTLDVTPLPTARAHLPSPALTPTDKTMSVQSIQSANNSQVHDDVDVHMSGLLAAADVPTDVTWPDKAEHDAAYTALPDRTFSLPDRKTSLPQGMPPRPLPVRPAEKMAVVSGPESAQPSTSVSASAAAVAPGAGAGVASARRSHARSSSREAFALDGLVRSAAEAGMPAVPAVPAVPVVPVVPVVPAQPVQQQPPRPPPAQALPPLPAHAARIARDHPTHIHTAHRGSHPAPPQPPRTLAPDSVPRDVNADVDVAVDVNADGTETGAPLRRKYDLTPGLDSGRRPRKTGLPMADLQRWLASTTTA